MTLIVDGYNLIFRMGISPEVDIEEARGILLSMLSAYGEVRRVPIIAVFDGARRQQVKGGGVKWVKVSFSEPPDNADDLIAKLAERHREGVIVVTDDRHLAGRIEQFGATRIRVEEFIERVEQAHLQILKGETCEEEERSPKKGPSKKLPKKMRRRKKKLEKI